MAKARYLVLEDQTVFEGKGFGGNHFEIGTLISNTAMIGYQEVLADHTNVGKILALTYPMIGSYGLTKEGIENTNPYLFGLIVGEKTDVASNWKAEMSLDEFLKLKEIPAIEGIDTRMLTKHIRQHGEMKAVLTDTLEDINGLIEQLQSTVLDENVVDKVSIKKSFRIPNEGDKILVLDLGATEPIIKELNLRNKDITVLPYTVSADEVLSIKPNGLIISNGPGTVEAIEMIIPTVQALLGKVPMFGIGLGHQLIALAYGAALKSLDFSQRGGNYPVKSLITKRIENVVKNHDRVVDENSLHATQLIMTHFDVNTKVVDGLMNEADFVNTVQYQPKNSDKISYDEGYHLFYQHIEQFKESQLRKGEYHA